MVQRYASILNCSINFELGPYDDSMGVIPDWLGKCDTIVQWFELDRLGAHDDASLAQAIRRIQSASDAPIYAYFACAPSQIETRDELLQAVSGRVTNWHPLVPDATFSSQTARHAELTGSGQDPGLALRIARTLGFRVIPSVTMPPLKLIACDLDNTLYRGILGEDGVSGVRQEDGHLALKAALALARESGILLALVSKNDLRDVQQLLAARPDLGYAESDFIDIRASWGSKSESIQAIASRLNIGIESCMFIDDNPAELLQVSYALQQVWLLDASEPREAAAVLTQGPWLANRSADSFRHKREADLRSQGDRQVLLASGPTGFESLHRELRTQVGAQLLPTSHQALRRASELIAKTNQFNATLARTTLAQLVRDSSAGKWSVSEVVLRDRFADSGVVGAAVLDVSQQIPELVELVLSCRALGRQLEDVLVWELLSAAGASANDNATLRIPYRVGPRNAPAIDFLQRYRCPSPIPSTGHEDDGLAYINVSKLAQEVATLSDGAVEIIDIGSPGGKAPHDSA